MKLNFTELLNSMLIIVCKSTKIVYENSTDIYQIIKDFVLE